MTEFKKYFEEKVSKFRYRNLNFEKRAQELGAYYDGEKNKWISHNLANKEFEDLETYYFSDMKVVEISKKQDAENYFEYAENGFEQYRHIAGYILAVATGRDSGAKVFRDVIILSGGFTSAGSAKNYYCAVKKDTKIRIRMSQSVLDEIARDEDLSKRYSIFICNSSLSTEFEKEAVEEFVEDEQILNALKILSKVSKERVKDIVKNN